jgi:ATP-dependent Clp protease ATP-binding subunit ClpA
MRRSRAEIEESKKPMGSFLFLGPTGVGKTETSKALAESYFGSEEAMIRFDMSEYQTKESIYRLIGDEQGGSGLLSERIFSNPHTLVLFDEAEKAEPSILNLFLQMLDEGFITDTVGRKIIFSNTIIIATSNAGSEYIREGVKNNVSYEEIKTGLMEELQQKGIFRPEFINRFTAVILFSPLSTEQTCEVAKMMVERLRLRLETEKEIKLDITEAAIAELALKGYSPEFGARALERTIQESLENVLAKKMISGEVARGATVKIDREDINTV